MRLARYFAFIGGALLALLFILDVCFPKLPVAAKPKVYLPVIRIYADQKWPERIVYDMSLPTIVPAAIASDVVVPTAEIIADASAGAKAQEAFALLPSPVDRLQVSNSNAKMRGSKPRYHRKFARVRASAPRIAMARHPQFGWFGRNFW